MGRYASLFRNALEDADYGAVARASGMAGKKLGVFLLRATALWAALQVWNNFLFDDEESELQDTDPIVANRIHDLHLPNPLVGILNGLHYLCFYNLPVFIGSRTNNINKTSAIRRIVDIGTTQG
jgi:hypothetical protein